MHFAVGREKTTSIAAVKKALLTIPPTFVEVERLFSVAGLFYTKMRTSLSGQSIDRLIRYFKFELQCFKISFLKFECLFIVMIL